MHALRELCVIQFRNVGECRQVAEPVARNADPERPAAEIEVRDAPGDRDEPIVVIDNGILDATAVADDEITDRPKTPTVLERYRRADDRAALEELPALSRVASPTTIPAPIAVSSPIPISPNTGANRSGLNSNAAGPYLDTDLTERVNGGKHQASSQTQTDISLTE